MEGVDEVRKFLTLVLMLFALAAATGGGYVPEWTDYNESDPGITLARGIDKDGTLWDW
jgi:hypothetical protein